MAKSQIITGLDIGSSTIKVLVAKNDPKKEELEVLAFDEENSLGTRKGVVVEPEETTAQIQLVFEKIKNQINKKINSVYLNIGGSHIFSTVSRGLVSVSRADQKISFEDIERLMQAAQTFNLPPNREVLELIPKEFIVDGERGLKEVLGLKGIRLEAEVLVFGGFGPYIKNLTTAVLNAGVQIEDLVISAIASSRSTLTKKEKELGVALLDIGAGTTDIAVFEEGNLIHLAVLPIGSANITNDIAIILKTDVDVAERIKLEFGTLFFQGTDKKEKIRLDDGEILIFSRRQLSKIIEARVSEIFREVNKELKKISRYQSLPGGIVLTGGGAKMPKIREFAKKEFRLPSRIGKPQGFSSLQEDPKLATVCGLVLKALDLKTEKEDFRGAFSFPSKTFFNKLKNFFKIFIP